METFVKVENRENTRIRIVVARPDGGNNVYDLTPFDGGFTVRKVDNTNLNDTLMVVPHASNSIEVR